MPHFSQKVLGIFPKPYESVKKKLYKTGPIHVFDPPPLNVCLYPIVYLKVSGAYQQTIDESTFLWTQGRCFIKWPEAIYTNSSL